MATPPSMGAINATTNTMPCLSFGAGRGRARMNRVSTGAMKDRGQATTWENSRHRLVPRARRRMRRAATG